MAGNYMNSPATRMAYDRDGSIGAAFTAAGLMSQLTAADLRAMNSEAEVGFQLIGQSRVAIIFPVPVDIAAVFFATNLNSTTALWTLETSKDTTTGIDGTWVAHQSGLQAFLDTKPNYRIFSKLLLTTPGAPSQSIRGVRMANTSSLSNVIKAFHIYADISATATMDRLAFWHPTLNEEVEPSYFDWGNVPRGSSADKSFRVKNLSSDLTANLVTLYTESLTPGSPSVAGMHTLSENGGSTFLSSVSADSILPGAISDLFILRRTIPTNAQVSVWSARISADVTNWS